MFAQNHNKNWRHNKVATVIQWQLCKTFGVERAEKWYDHKEERILENAKSESYVEQETPNRQRNRNLKT